MPAAVPAAQSEAANDVSLAETPSTPPSINGIALLAPGETLSAEHLLERAHAELLRQEAVRLGLPAGKQVSAIGDGLLGASCVECGNPARLEARSAPRIEHFLAPRRERHDLFAGNSGGLEIAVLADRTDCIAQLLDRQPGLVEIAHHLVECDFPRLAGPRAAIPPL